MIHLSTISVENMPTEKEDWRKLFSDSKINTRQLLAKVGLDHHPLASADAEQLFELRVPKPFIDKMEFGNANDPLLLQVLPQSQEFLEVPGFSSDPLKETEFSPVPGVIHKYVSRVLFITNQACTINCRYCFRRSFPYQAHRQSRKEWQAAIDYIRSQNEVNEVVLSGGDPLSLSNEHLKWLLSELDALPQLKRIRIHSRLALVLPQRVDDELIALLSACTRKLIMVIHCNHPNELGDDVAHAMQRLNKAGVHLFNQTVLLKQVNDSAETLASLSEALFDLNIQPYYLFTLDKVAGAAHFDLPRAEVKQLYRDLLSRLPGFLVPKLVAEIPGAKSKTPLDI